MTRVGLVGCGRWGANILRDLKVLDCHVTVVARSHASVARARAGGADEVVARLGAGAAVDAVVVATPIATHALVVAEVLELGVPVFCEKPLTTDVEQVLALDRAADGRLFVMDKWRYHPGIEALADLVRTGELGRPVGLLSVREQWGSPHPDVDTLWVHLPHDLAIGLEVLGALPDARTAVVERVGGQVTGLHGTLGTSPWLVVSHSMAAPHTRRLVRLTCEDGTATLADSAADVLHVARGRPERGHEPERRPISTEWPLLRELRAFIEHVHGGRPPRTPAREHAVIVERLAQLRALGGLAPG